MLIVIDWKSYRNRQPSGCSTSHANPRSALPYKQVVCIPCITMNAMPSLLNTEVGCTPCDLNTGAVSGVRCIHRITTYAGPLLSGNKFCFRPISWHFSAGTEGSTWGSQDLVFALQRLAANFCCKDTSSASDTCARVLVLGVSVRILGVAADAC